MAWEPDYFRLFISHVSAYHDEASQVAIWLRDRWGIHGFVAHADINPSAVWQDEIENSLRTMDALLALLSPGFSKSLWCNQEVGWALGRPSLALSVRLGEDPQGFVGKFQAISGGGGNPFGIAQRVFESLAVNPTTAERVGVAVSMFLRRADSWEQVRDHIVPALSRVTQFSNEALDNLQTAFQERYHVRTSRFLDDIRSRLVASGRPVPNT